MSELCNELKKRKKELLYEKQLLETSLSKLNIPGYITEKNIRGKKTTYLQFRDDNDKVVSVYLSKDKEELCREVFGEKDDLQNKLMSVKDDLELLDKVEVDDGEQIFAEDEGNRLLDGAAGISLRHRILFYLIPGDEKGEYTIRFFGKKDCYNKPMVYVNEKAYSRIADYCITAGCIVDEAVDALLEMGEMKAQREKGRHNLGRTDGGIKFKYTKKEDNYELSFFYKKKKYEIPYEPYFACGDPNAVEVGRMGFFIDQNIRLMTFTEGVSKYYGRKQDVHPKTKKS